MLIFFHDFAPSAILFSLGPLHIYWYGFFIACAFVVGYSGWKRTIIKTHGTASQYDSLCLWIAIGGVIGARLYHVVNELPWYGVHPWEIFALWNGGLAIHGALIGGLIALFIACKKYRVFFVSHVNTLVPWVAFGQAIGRWGNYFNQELYGAPSQLPWAIFINPAHRMQGFEETAYYHPVFLYESLLLVGLGFVLLKMITHKQWKDDGIIYYILGAGMIRLCMELIRIDPVPMIAGVRLPMIASIVFVVIGGAWLCAKRWKRVVQ